MKRATKSSRTTLDSEMVKLRRDKFALLARVGQRKREALAFQDEATFYYGIVIDLLATLGEAMALLRVQNPEAESPEVGRLMSQHIRSVRRLLGFWPQNSESQGRILSMLDCDGLAMVTDNTKEGYVIPSSALILESVERIIAAIKTESNQNPSSDSTREPSDSRGIDSGEQVISS